MKFRTRLLITSVTIVLLPLLLTCAALLVVGSHIEDVETPSDFLTGIMYLIYTRWKLTAVFPRRCWRK